MRFDWVTRLSLDNLRPLLSLLSEDLAIDLGTVNTRVYAGGMGIVVNEASAVALDDSTGQVQAVGKEAKKMLGRTPRNIRVVKPLKDGVIADFKVIEKMLSCFIQKAHQRRTLVHPRIVISVPSEITQVEKRAVTDSAYRAKASEVHLVEQAMMAAIGAGLPVTAAGGNMVVDIGGGTTDVAIISLSGIVYSHSLRTAGNHMDEAIMNYLKRKYNLLIGERTAEQIKTEIGSAYTLDKPLTMEIKGRSLIEGIPKAITVDDSEIREALSECVSTIVSAVRLALESTPPSADISDRGIVLTGGGALLKNLDKRIREETGLPLCVAHDPLCSVVLGTGKILSDFKLSFARLSVQEGALLLKLTQNPRCAFRHALDLELWDARDEVPLGKRQNTSQTEKARVGEEWVPLAEALLYGIVW
jgi:rod shape-determining protein MreB and related proteins